MHAPDGLSGSLSRCSSSIKRNTSASSLTAASAVGRSPWHPAIGPPPTSSQGFFAIFAVKKPIKPHIHLLRAMDREFPPATFSIKASSAIEQRKQLTTSWHPKPKSSPIVLWKFSAERSTTRRSLTTSRYETIGAPQVGTAGVVVRGFNLSKSPSTLVPTRSP